MTSGRRPRRRLSVPAAALVLAAVMLPALARGAVHDTTLASRATGPDGAAADGDSLPGLAVSGSGRFVAFTSTADNLSASDDDTVTNVYLRDTETGATELISRADGAAGAGANGDSGAPAVSPAGRFVAFESAADNLSAADDDSVKNVYLRDTLMGRTELVSRADGAAGAGANGDSFDPSVSALVTTADGDSGPFVAFESDADNLSAEDDDSVRNVFVRDAPTGTTTLASRASGAAGAGANGDSSDPSISSNGQKVAYASAADNLSADDDDSVTNVYLYDLRFRFVSHVSRSTRVGSLSDPADADSSAPALSADGRQVAFVSYAENMTSDAGPTPGVADVFVRDAQASKTTLMSRATGAAGPRADADSGTPSISADGRVVAFLSAAANLSDDDGPGADAFVRSGVPVAGGTLDYTATILVSRATGAYGTAADAGTTDATLAGDSTAVAYLTAATNLSDTDGDPLADVFVREMRFGAPPPPPPDLGTGEHGGHTGHDAGHTGHDAGAHFSLRVGGSAAERIFGTDSHDKVCGGPGNDYISLRAGPDVAYGDLCGAADPPLEATTAGAGARQASPPPAGASGNDSLVGGKGDDELYGGWGNDRLVGGSGADTLYGGVGRDRLIGGPGVNAYSAGPGNDSVNAANGKKETVNCGAGRDTARVDRRDRVRGCESVRRVRGKTTKDLPDLLPECPGGGHDCHVEQLPECPGGGHDCHQGGGVVVLSLYDGSGRPSHSR